MSFLSPISFTLPLFRKASLSESPGAAFLKYFSLDSGTRTLFVFWNFRLLLGVVPLPRPSFSLPPTLPSKRLGIREKDEMPLFDLVERPVTRFFGREALTDPSEAA